MENGITTAFHPRKVLVFAALIVLVAQLIYAVAASDRIAARGFLGPDSYMRMLRIEKLFGGAGWYDRISERTNAPYGESLPWGRPLDIVLVGLAAIVAPFTDARTAVYAAGLAVAPLIAFLMIAVWSWGTRSFLGTGAFLAVVALSTASPQILLNLQIGRPDHHGFLALLFVVQLCAAFRLATGAGGRGAAFVMGLAGGVAVWASVMELLAQIMFSLVLAARHLRGNGGAGRDFLFYTSGMALVLTVGLPIERPPADLLTVNAERLSIAHWALAASGAATWWAVHRYLRRQGRAISVRARIGSLAVGTALPLGLTAALFPAVFLGPTSGYAPEAVAFSFARVVEFQPLFPTTLARFSEMLIHLGWALIGLGFIIADYRRASGERRMVYDILLTGFAVYIPMSLWVVRFALVAQVLALVPMAMLLARLMESAQSVRLGEREIPLRVLAVVAALAAPLALGLMVRPAGAPGAPPIASRPGADWAAMGEFLTRYAPRSGAEAGPRRILFTYQFIGPEIVWRTPYTVVGAPYGNGESIRDSFAIFGAKTDEDAKRVIDRRGIDLVLYSRTESENAAYRGSGGPDTLLNRIENGRAPDWLAPVPLPDSLSRDFRLFRVVRRPPG